MLGHHPSFCYNYHPPVWKHMVIELSLYVPPTCGTVFLFIIKVHLTRNTFFAKINLCTCWKSIAPFFAKRWLFIGFQTYEKVSIIWYTTEHEGAWVYSWFDVTNWFASHKVLQRVNMRYKAVFDVKSRIDPRPFWLGRVPNGAYFFISLEAYKKPTFGKKGQKRA